MYQRLRNTSIGIYALALSLPACADSETFHVRIGDAELPVYVQHPDRPILLVFESGGPSGTAIDGVLAGYYPWADCFGDAVSVATYDRRGTGNARGLVDDSSIHIETYEDDLLAVTRALEQRYAPDRVIWMAHSWGADLALRVLRDQPDRVDGFVAVDGGYLSTDEQYVSWRRDFVCRVAADRLAAGDDDPLWPEITDYCDRFSADQVVYRGAGFDELWGYLGVISDRYDDGFPLTAGGVVRGVFFSHYDVFDSHLRGDQIARLLHEQTRDDPVFDDLGKVTTPTLIINGELDDLIPTELATAAFDQLATPAEQKSFVEIAGSSHSPFISQTERFCAVVRAFVDPG
jgi:pimeloyl-ACP methyl ester carboxylesterase